MDAPAGTPLPAPLQTAGDCQVAQCDGNGGTKLAVDDTDVPVDGNDCTQDLCTSGVPSNPALPVGSACSQDGGELCDAASPTPKCNHMLAYVVVGDGSGTLTATSATVSIAYVFADGTAGKKATDISGGATFSLSGSATSEGGLSRSVDTRYVTLAGYAAAPGTGSVSTSSSSSTNRAVARVDASGAIDASTLLAGAFSGSNVRGVTTIDGSAFWISGNSSGSTGGIWYAPLGLGASAAQLTGQSAPANPPSNVRFSGIFGDQLFVTSGSSPFVGASSVGASPPPTALSTATNLSGTSTSGTNTPSPYGLVLFDLDASTPGLDTLYLCDDRSTANGGGIQKWKLGAGGAWALSTTFKNGLTAGCRGLTGWVSGTSVVLAATTSDTPSKVVAVTDDGSAAPAFTTLATATTNIVFRGVALAPR